MTGSYSNPLVSIVTPSYNQAEYLELTLQSVLAQDYPAIEYLVVDGGSTDGSLEILHRYSDRLAWWVSEPDSGQAEAINKGMQRASGEIVGWLNSDDLLLPGAVRQAVRCFAERPESGMVFGDAITIDERGRPIRKLAFPDWQLVDLLSFRIICQPAVFIRREIFFRAGGMDQDYHYMLDHHLWVRIASLAPIRHVPKILAAARHHAGAKNVSQATGFGHESMRLLAWMERQSDLSPLVKQHRRRILGGAYRLNARYLLDGDQYREALKSYSIAFLNQPGYTLHHWHRILYAMLGLLGGKSFKYTYLRWRDRISPDVISGPALENWPGLNLK
jgi:glycosyltransferase involved in cell wall biosynthesis